MTLPPLPCADFNDLWTLLLALLGMSGLRSIDKTRQNNIGPTQAQHRITKDELT